MLQSSNKGAKVRDDPTSSTDSQGRGSQPIPDGSLGLSQAGTIAYWVDNGQPRSARIP